LTTQRTTIVLGIVATTLVVAIGFLAIATQLHPPGPLSSQSTISSASTTTATTTQCVQTGPYGTLLVQVNSDASSSTTNSSSAVQGATISGFVSVNCGVGPQSSTVVRTAVETVVTPSNGTVTDFGPRLSSANYSLAISYSNRTYDVTAGIFPEQLTWVTLNIPSGKVKISTMECYPQFMKICGYEVINPTTTTTNTSSISSTSSCSGFPPGGNRITTSLSAV
jgi:hypothetical protein